MRQSNHLALIPTGRLGRQRLLLATLVLMTLFTLACSLFGPSRPRIARLPTLTRTPLPTLTPTVLAASSGGAEVVDAAELVANMPAETDLAAAQQPAVDNAGGEAAPVEAPLPANNPNPAVADASAETAPVAQVAAPSADVPAITSPPTEADSPTEPNTQSPPETPPPADAPPPTPTATPTVTPLPDATATPTPQPVDLPDPAPSGEGWVFSAVRAIEDGGNLLVHGELLNDTGVTQKLAAINGTFYDAQGQVIASGNTSDWPIGTFPQGGKMPFRLSVPGTQSIANADWQVEATPSDTDVRSNLKFASLKPAIASGAYCFSGQLQAPDDGVPSTVVMVVILYDRQKNVLNFDQQNLTGSQTLPMEVCADSFNQAIGAIDVRVWGM